MEGTPGYCGPVRGANAVRRFRSLGAQGPRPLAGYRKAVLCPVGTITCLQSQIGRCCDLRGWGTAQVGLLRSCPWVSAEDRSGLL